MQFNYNCRARLFFEKEEQALEAMNALLPEIDSSHNKRSETRIDVKKGMLSLNINALDAVALRASLNSALRLIGLVQKVSEVE